MLIARYPLLALRNSLSPSAFCFPLGSMKTKNASEEGKGKTMNNEHKHMPGVIAMVYLRGSLTALKDQQSKLVDDIIRVSAEIDLLEGRLT
jgi:hypothetical protein